MGIPSSRGLCSVTGSPDPGLTICFVKRTSNLEVKVTKFLVDTPVASLSNSRVFVLEFSHSQDFQKIEADLEAEVTEIQTRVRSLVLTPTLAVRFGHV